MPIKHQWVRCDYASVFSRSTQHTRKHMRFNLSRFELCLHTINEKREEPHSTHWPRRNSTHTHTHTKQTNIEYTERPAKATCTETEWKRYKCFVCLASFFFCCKVELLYTELFVPILRIYLTGLMYQCV